MALLKKFCEKIILIIILTSLLITFVATPASYAKLDLKDGDFYYSGTTKGTYVVKDGIFAWLLNCIADIADFIIGLIAMAIRMIFVGWTALVEKLLTWAIESTTGVSMAGKAVEDGISSTDLTSITDSSNNLTVQAIVYNKVPVFNINFFELDYDKSVSGTGQKYKCSKCDQDVDVCVSITDSGPECSCDCKGKCDGCKTYIEALSIDQTTNPSVVTQIKNLVSMWYYIIRLIALAAMLVVLIAVGIKMAISTVASEKAVYKRMLVDWVVGIIILFAIHYMMIFIIYINETLVNVISDSATHINTVTMKQLSGTEDNKYKSNQDIEIDTYEAVRTRAYDPKLAVGLSGMLMYMTLVYFAIRYTLVYIKRYFTLIVLTLMGPAVGVAYALQKVLNGKSSTLKTWISEYTMNVIIQPVHALIYAVFISSALVLSLESISGMIVALIFMNYSLKAEAQFRKIFKFGDGDSLVGHTAEAGSAEKMKQNLKTATGLYMAAKPLATSMLNTPYANVVKGAYALTGLGVAKTAEKAGKLGAKAVRAGASKVNSMRGRGGANQTSGGNEGNNTYSGGENSSNSSSNTSTSNTSTGSTTKASTSSNFRESDLETTKGLMVAGKDSLKNSVILAANKMNQTEEGTPEREKAEKEFNIAMENYMNYDSLGLPSTKEIIKEHGERLVDIDNHFRFAKNDKGRNINFSNLKKFKDGVFGTSHRDLKTGKLVSDKNALYQQFMPAKLLGISDADKKVFKEQVINPIKSGLGGIASMFVGMGTMVAHPTMGMALLGGGAKSAHKTFKKPENYKGYKGRYGFSKFSTPTMREIQKAAVARANRELNSMTVQNVKENHPELYKKLKQKDVDIDWKASGIRNLRNGALASLSVGTLGLIAGAGLSFVPIATVGAAGFVSRFFIKHTGVSANLREINKHSIKQVRDQQLEFMKDGLSMQMSYEKANMEDTMEKQDNEFMKKLYEDLGFEYDSKTGNIKKKESAMDDYNKVIIDLYEQQGMKYDPRTGTLTPIPGKDNSDANISKSQIKTKFTKKNGTIIGDKDVKIINEEFNKLVNDMLKSSKELDVDSETIQDEVINKLSSKLEVKGILSHNQKIDEILRDGRAGLVNVLKKKVSNEQNKDNKVNIENSKALLEIDKILDKTEKARIQNAVEELSKEQMDYSNLQTKDVLAKLKGNTNPQQGSQPAPEQRSTGKVRISDIEEDKLKKALNAYIGNLKDKDSKVVSKKSAKDMVEAKTNRRRKKMQQVLELTLDGSEENSPDALIDKVKKNEPINGDTLSQAETADVIELLLIRKELSEINRYGREELELKAGNVGYVKSAKSNSKKAVAYYGDKLEIETYKNQDDRSREYIDNLDRAKAKAKAEGKTTKQIEKVLEKVAEENLKDLASKLQAEASTTGMRREDIYEELNKLSKIQGKQKKLDATELTMRKSDRALDNLGPISNINTFIRNLSNDN